MAEAVVDGPPMSRFFCHKCSVEIERLLPDYTCPYCTLGFIEQLEGGGGGGGTEDGSQADQRSYLHGSNMDISGEYFSDIDLDVEPRPNDDFIRMYLDFPQEIRDTGEGGRVNGGRRQSSRGPRSHTTPDQRHEPVHLDAMTAQRVLRGRPHRHVQPVEHLIENFILNLSGFGLNYMPNAQGGHQPVLFLGNPGDYVWGRDGLDTIVTQLLNQMDGSGPPPLPRKQIDEIPTASVSQSQIDIKLQCSICWEDFILAELVRQLPCKHVYHTPCIEPWLELHGTCPICRQSLGDQTSADANRDTVGPSLAALFRAANQSTNSRTASSASSSSTSTSDE